MFSWSLAPRRLLAMCLLYTALLLAFAGESFAARCESCNYKAFQCDSTDPNDLGLKTCDVLGRINQPDMFCGDDGCQCAEGFDCVNLQVGCTAIRQSRGKKRCVSNDSLDYRYKSCQGRILNTPRNPNLMRDWKYFNENSTLCSSEDCRVTKAFRNLNLMGCGHLVTAWKDEDATVDYHFIVDGSLNDGTPGEFHFTIPFDSISGSDTKAIDGARVIRDSIADCYNIQTLNSPGNQIGLKCDGIYYTRIETTGLSMDDVGTKDLSWPVIFVIVGSIVAALVMSVVAVYVYRKNLPPASEEDGDKGEEKSISKSPEVLRQRVQTVEEDAL